VVEEGIEDEEFKSFENQFNEELNLLGSSIWIIKPGENTNRGTGIIVSKDFNEIKQLVMEKSADDDKTAII
jgi:hypothetical protein